VLGAQDTDSLLALVDAASPGTSLGGAGAVPTGQGMKQ